MTRWLQTTIATGLLLLGSAAGFLHHRGVVLYAQSLPYAAHVFLLPPAASDNVVNYQVSLDGTVVVATAAPTVDPTCSCIKIPISIATAGSHTASVVAQNQALSTDPTTLQSSAATTVPFTLNVTPPGNPVKSGNGLGK